MKKLLLIPLLLAGCQAAATPAPSYGPNVPEPTPEVQKYEDAENHVVCYIYRNNTDTFTCFHVAPQGE